MTHNVFGSIDGENLVLRFEDMVRAGAIPKPGVVYIPGVLVWHPDITHIFMCQFTRIAFYQTVVGDSKRVDEVRKVISEVRYDYQESRSVGGRGSLHPKLFKKEKKGAKTKSVDINIAVDVLRTVMNRNGDVVLLASGDGDYLPLVEEVMRHGKQVWLCAFSKGLSTNLRFAADDFYDLDSIFFERPNHHMSSDGAASGPAGYPER